jgi:hypothetical protein
MTDPRSAAQIFADIFGPAPTERERSLIVRVALLENYILELECQSASESGSSAILMTLVGKTAWDAHITGTPR